MTANPQKSQSEIQIQAAAFQAAWNDFPETRGLIFHVPNGGARNKIEGMQLKASGVIAGIPDIILLWQGKAYGFEFKTLTGHLSPAQEKIHSTWKNNGIPVYVIRDAEVFIAHVARITGLTPRYQRSSSSATTAGGAFF